MKITIFGSKVLRVVALCLLVVMLPVLNSCKKETADVSDLLSKVPSSAGVVVGMNLKSILEKGGCKVNGTEVTPGKELEEWVNKGAAGFRDEREAVKLFLSGESGIDPNGAIFFIDAYNSYITAVVADTPKFTAFVEKQTGNTFSEENGVKVCGNVAMVGVQVWMSVGSDSVDAKAIKNYAGMDEGQSFLANDFSKNISTMTHDIVGWGQLNALLRKGMSFSDFAAVNMVPSMLYDGATSVAFNIDFNKGELKAEASVHNDKGDYAKYLLPADKVSLDDIRSLGESAEAIAAVSVTKDLVKKIDKMSSSLGGNLLGQWGKMIGSLDGTIAAAISNPQDLAEGISAVVTTDGNPSLELMTVLSQLAPTKRDGKLVRMSKGTLSGNLNIAKAAEYLKGSTMGVVLNADSHEMDGLKTIAVSLNPEKGSLTLHFTAIGIDNSENILLTFMKNNR